MLFACFSALAGAPVVEIFSRIFCRLHESRRPDGTQLNLRPRRRLRAAGNIFLPCGKYFFWPEGNIFLRWRNIFFCLDGNIFGPRVEILVGRLRGAFLRRGLGGPKIHGSTSRLRRKLAEVRAQPDELWQKRPRRRGIGGSWRTRQHGCPPRAGTMLGLPDVGGGSRSIPPRWCRILTWMSPGGTLLPTRRRSGPPRPWQRRALVAGKKIPEAASGVVSEGFGPPGGARGLGGRARALGGARGRLGTFGGA